VPNYAIPAPGPGYAVVAEPPSVAVVPPPAAVVRPPLIVVQPPAVVQPPMVVTPRPAPSGGIVTTGYSSHPCYIDLRGMERCY
jgi:hypothetical protein